MVALVTKMRIKRILCCCKHHSHQINTKGGTHITIQIKGLVGSTDQACSRDSYFRIKNCMNIDGMLSFSSKTFPLISAGPQNIQT